jgi:hypothetical protein
MDVSRQIEGCSAMLPARSIRALWSLVHCGMTTGRNAPPSGHTGNARRHNISFDRSGNSLLFIRQIEGSIQSFPPGQFERYSRSLVAA